MTEQVSLTIIAISVAMLAVGMLVGTILLFVVARRLLMLAQHIEQLTDQIRESTLPVLTDLGSTIRSVSQIASLAANMIKPIATSAIVSKAVPWLRVAGIATSVAKIVRHLRPGDRHNRDGLS